MWCSLRSLRWRSAQRMFWALTLICAVVLWLGESYFWPERPSCPLCAPAQYTRPELVIPVGASDMCTLSRLARSVAVWDWESVLGNVILVWTSDQPLAAYRREVEQVALLFERPAKIVTVVDPDLYGYEWQGWYAQQLSKLLVADLISTEYYVVLDAKDVFVRPVARGDLFDQCNRAITHTTGDSVDSLPGPHDWWMMAALNALSNATMTYDEAREACRKLGPIGESVTPKAMHTQSVRDLIRVLTGPPLSWNLMEAICSGAVEFMVYTVYMLRHPHADCVHVRQHMDRDRNPLYVKLWRDQYFPRSRAFRSTRAVLRDDWDPLIFAVQRGALNWTLWTDAYQAEAKAGNNVVDSKPLVHAALAADQSAAAPVWGQVDRVSDLDDQYEPSAHEMAAAIYELFYERRLTGPNENWPTLVSCISGPRTEQSVAPKDCKLRQ